MNLASTVAEYTVPHVTTMPDGFVLSALEYSDQYVSVEEFSGGEHIVSQTLRNGLETINVSTSRIPDYVAIPYKLFANADVVQSVRLTSGMYAGQTVQVAQPGVLSQHFLWGIKDGVVFVISGTAPDNDLIAIANGLQKPA